MVFEFVVVKVRSSLFFNIFISVNMFVLVILVIILRIISIKKIMVK